MPKPVPVNAIVGGVVVVVFFLFFVFFFVSLFVLRLVMLCKISAVLQFVFVRSIVISFMRFL